MSILVYTTKRCQFHDSGSPCCMPVNANRMFWEVRGSGQPEQSPESEVNLDQGKHHHNRIKQRRETHHDAEWRDFVVLSLYGLQVSGLGGGKKENNFSLLYNPICLKVRNEVHQVPACIN